MNHASEWRLELAKKIAPLYSAYPNVRAIAVAGSVGRGWADGWSDIELTVYWSAPPTDAERMAPIEKLRGSVLEYFPFEPDEWEESYLLDDVKMELNHYLVPTIERFIQDVVEQFDTAVYKHLRLAEIQGSIPLYHGELIEQWRTRIADYPDELARRLIKENIEFGGWNGVEMMLARGDLLLAYDLLVKVQKQVVAVLLALNRTYMAHPRGKWLQNIADGMQYKPARLAERMLFALRDGSVAGAREMHGVIEETFALVEEQFPEIDLTAAKRDARFRRERISPPQ